MVDQRELLGSGTLSRRAVVTAVTAVAGSAVLAACGSSTAATPAAASSSGSGSAPAPAAGDGSIVALAAVPVGGSVSAQLDGKPIIVSQPKAGEAVAFTAICTHRGCTVEPAGAQLHCPCHGSVYNALTGANISGPAPKPLAAIPVDVANGNVVAG